GLGRGPSMAAAYLVQQGKTPDEAWATIRAIRPFIRPNDVQKQRLDEFAQYAGGSVGKPSGATTTNPGVSGKDTSLRRR
ncbi:MAG: hypothetical protein KC547_08440, partial [Anaerolineae bacterium]|nr:hypothetical protein [Anaerolineae bacterium]